MFFTMRQNKQKEEEEKEKKDEPKEAFNPYKEARRTGKSVEEVKAEQAKKEAKLAKKKARKNKGNETVQDKKIENCAELLNNVYHVHAPAPISKEDRSVNALIKMRKDAARAEKAEDETGRLVDKGRDSALEMQGNLTQEGSLAKKADVNEKIINHMEDIKKLTVEDALER